MHAPGCAKPELTRLLILRKVGEPPGHADHQIAYDHDVIEICPACNGATLEKLAHDCFDFEEVWDQYEWYELTPEDGARLRAIAAKCPAPLDQNCACPAHTSMRASAATLPRTSWDVGFEWNSHKHVVALDGKDDAPVFTLVSSIAPAPSRVPVAPAGAKPADAKTVVFVVVAWPLVLGAMLLAWYKLVHLPTIVDVLFVALAIPVSFVVSGMIMALITTLVSPAAQADLAEHLTRAASPTPPDPPA